MSFWCTCSVAWCVQDHVWGGLPHADSPLVVSAPPVSTVSLAPRTSCWQIAGPSGSLSPHPSKARTLPHSDRVQLPEHGHGRPAPLCLDALVPTTQVHPQPAGLESVPSHPHPLEALGIDPTPAHHTTRLVLHHSLEGNGTWGFEMLSQQATPLVLYVAGFFWQSGVSWSGVFGMPTTPDRSGAWWL